MSVHILVNRPLRGLIMMITAAASGDDQTILFTLAELLCVPADV
jgi:hypothetical protein